MTYEELLEAVKDIPTTRAVVELHKELIAIAYDRHGNERICDWTKCAACPAIVYPCKTIQKIEEQLK